MDLRLLTPLGRIVRKNEIPGWSDARAARDDLELAKQALEASKIEVFDAARADGFKAGLEEGKKEASLLVMRTASQLASRTDELERQLPSLIIDIVENLLGEFNVGDVLAACIKRALKDLHAKTEIALEVCPTDFEDVSHAIAHMSSEKGMPPIRVRCDEEMSTGDCRLTGDFGFLDLSLKTQMNILRKGLGGQVMDSGYA